MRRLWWRFALAAGLALQGTVSGQELVLSATQKQALDVQVGKAEAAASVPLDGLPATVRVPLEGANVVTAPYPGVVVAVLAREGEAVRRGQPLARIQSREAMTLGADLAAAQGEFRVAAAEAARDRQLLAEGIIPASRRQTAEARREAAAARLRALQAARAIAPAAAGAAPGTYELRAPLDGNVLQRDLRPGEPVGQLAKAYVIAPRDRVMLELQVPARYAPSLRVGLPVRVDGEGEGTVSEAGGAVDPLSQTVLVRAELRSRGLLPGRQTTAILLLPAPPGAVAVPSAALVDRAGKTVLFTATARGYAPVPVERLAQSADGRSVVRGALAQGAAVVVRGAGALNAIPQGGE
ncbi:efflux RND transporter periplasmic adaptor subunit [Frateuria defendens]|uniref:efflux RND transporter periplasmic adaptor subunit n=1 Tax=Frateuria defendens TaxID=2219559 RepID=UPI00066FE47A|nr:efflux RND transporter periplasmic adaptor subunit [Frateuria defendens]